MRILYLIDSVKIGGAEILLLSMIKRYTAQGHHVEVAYFSDGALRQEFEDAADALHRISERGLKDPGVFRRTVELVRTFQPDVIHTHLFKSDLVGQLVARWENVPVRISSAHNINPWRKNPLLSAIMKRVMGRCQRIIAVSVAVHEYIIRWGKFDPNTVLTIPNGVSLSYFDPSTVESLDKTAVWGIPADAPTVGIIARLAEAKAHDVFLNAAFQVYSQHPEVRFIIVGDGELRTALEAQAKFLGLDEVVIFAGIMRDMPRVMASLDIVAFSSRWEGLPVAMLEAMAMERPIVATPVGSIPDTLTDGKEGLLVPVGDADKLAEALIDLVEHPDKAQQMGKIGRQTIQADYSDEKMHADIMALYEELYS